MKVLRLILTPSRCASRATSTAASRECPPRSKKLSSTPTWSRPSTCANTSHSACSRAVAGARPPAAAYSGAGSARRSSFPFALSGSASSTMTAAGTMYPGSTRPHASRSPAGSSTAPAAGTTYPASRLSPGWSSRTATAACAHPRQAGQHGLDLAQLDPEPADLHLVIGPAQVLQLPGRVPPGQVPGPVHPLPRPRRTGTPRTAPRSAPAGPGTPAPAPPPPRTAPPPPPAAPAPALRPARTPACSRSGGRSAAKPRPARRASTGIRRGSTPSPRSGRRWLTRRQTGIAAARHSRSSAARHRLPADHQLPGGTRSSRAAGRAAAGDWASPSGR